MHSAATATPDKAESTYLVITCLVDHPKAVALLRTARIRAQELNARWRAVYIQTPDDERSDGTPGRMAQLMALAAQMGAEIVHMQEPSPVQAIEKLLKNEQGHIMLIVAADMQSMPEVPRKQASGWDKALHMLRKHNLSIEILPLSQPNYRQTLGERLRWLKVRHVLYAFVAVGIAFLAASELEMTLPPALFRINNQNVGLLFMIACAFVAGRFGLLPGLVASILSLLIVNYDFTVPYHSFKFNNLTDMLNMVLFLFASLLISLFTSQTRALAERAAKRELNTQALFTLYRVAANASSRAQAIEELQRKLMAMLMMDVAFFLPPALNPDAIIPICPEGLALDAKESAALVQCWKEIKTTGLSSPFYPESRWRFEPMIAPGGEVGVLGVKPLRKSQLDAWFGRLLTAIADQTGTALEHIELERSMEATRIREEREKLRSMLLSSVSHDLKTPLASIIGALSIYRSQGKKLALEKQEMLIETALQESERLDSFITNILDMTHLESGKIEFKREWGDMQGIIQHVARRLEHRLRQHKIVIHPAPKNVEIMMDIMMLEQVLQNVLDNACKYTPQGTLIEINSAIEGKDFVCSIRDHGTGLPNEKLEHVFDKYARLHKQDSQIAGTGLGLAICKAMMEAQGGSIVAANHPDGGAIFTLHMPKWREADTTKYVA